MRRGQVDVLQDVDEVVESVELKEAGHGGPLDYCQGEDVEAEDHVESDEGVAQREQRVERVVRGPGRAHAVVPPAPHSQESASSASACPCLAACTTK